MPLLGKLADLQTGIAIMSLQLDLEQFPLP